MSIYNTGKSADMKVITQNELIANQKVKCLKTPITHSRKRWQ